MKLFDSTFNRWNQQILSSAMQKIPGFITPNKITIFSFVVSFLTASILYFTTHNVFWIFGTALVLCIPDIFDGALARFRGENSKLGKILDTVCDIFLCVLYLVILVLLGKIGFFLVYILILLYLARIYFAFYDREVEIGGLRPSLIIGVLICEAFNPTLYTYLLPVFIGWNLISILSSMYLDELNQIFQKLQSSYARYKHKSRF